MYINMSDYTYSFSTSTSNTYTANTHSWNPAYPVWGNTTSNAEQPRPRIVLDSNGLWVDGNPFWNMTNIDFEEEHVSIEELDDVLEEVS